MKKQITLTVNHQEHTILINPDEKLSTIIRERLHLTGTKIGCGEGVCGTCTVLLNGKPVLSCVYPAEKADGKNVLTIEGLAKQVNDQLKLHPLQEAFIQYGAVQCGFCTPAQILSAYALLKRDPNPSRAEIRRALKNKLCRCAAYPSIENAILAAAQSLISGAPIPPANIPESLHAGKIIGRSQIRPDAKAKVTGDALFTDDLQFEGMLHAKVLRAMVPHAILKHLDITKALHVEGVSAIMTAADIPGDHYHGLVYDDWPVMVGIGERIRYVGDAIAIVAAQTKENATLACDLIEAEFDHRPVITNPIQSIREDQPQLHPNGNLLKHIEVRKGDIDEGFKEADITLEHTFHTQTTDHAFLEPECSIAVPTEDGRMEIYVGSQIPYADRRQVAKALGWTEERVHVKGQLMGGGFGGKEDISGQIHAALLANTTQKPVKLLFDRTESLLVHPKRHATQIRVKVGAKKDGRLTAVSTELFGDTGAYASLGDKVMTRATTHSAGPYDIPHVRADCYAMYTNNPPAGAFRGFGVTQSTFAIESMMDMLARKLNIDPVEIRQMNALHLGSITNTGQVINESIGLNECIEKATEEMHKQNPRPFQPVVDESQPDIVRAWGIAAAYKNTGLGGGAQDRSSAVLELSIDGTFEIRSSAAELGQGLVTVMRMIIAEEMAVSPEKVQVLVMDTDLSPDGGPTTASRQTYVTGNACRYAAIKFRNMITDVISEIYQIPSEKVLFKKDLVFANGTAITYEEVYEKMIDVGQEPFSLYEYNAPKTQALGTGGDMHFAYSYGVQCAEVEVNKKTGDVRVLRVIAVNDLGTVINPLGAQGQAEGGVMMGLGNCLTEEFKLENGYVVTDKMTHYHIPNIIHTPDITSIIVEHPTKDGPYGAKGIGEISSIPTTPAITNAIFNAVGVRIYRTPIDPKILTGK